MRLGIPVGRDARLECGGVNILSLWRVTVPAKGRAVLCLSSPTGAG
jgi:hypothetical protein